MKGLKVMRDIVDWDYPDFRTEWQVWIDNYESDNT